MIELDIPEEVVRHYKSQLRLMRWICYATGGFLLLLAAYYSLRAQLYVGWTASATFALVLVALVGGVLLVAAIWKWMPGATNVIVDNRGITFTGPKKRRREVQWSGKGLPLVIFHTEGASDEFSGGKPVHAVSGRTWLQDFLSTATFEAIKRIARANNLIVDEQPALRPGWSRITISRPK
jgi:hypothetical protein